MPFQVCVGEYKARVPSVTNRCMDNYNCGLIPNKKSYTQFNCKSYFHSWKGAPVQIQSSVNDETNFQSDANSWSQVSLPQLVVYHFCTKQQNRHVLALITKIYTKTIGVLEKQNRSITLKSIFYSKFDPEIVQCGNLLFIILFVVNIVKAKQKKWST